MDALREAELFDTLCRNARVREWLLDQMARQVKILVVNPDVEALHRAQGRAQFIQQMLDRLIAAEFAARR